MKRFLKVFAMAVSIALCTGCEVKPCSLSIPYPQPGACPIPGVPEGEPGGTCPGWPSGCDPSTTCIQGVCLPTGGDGEGCTGPHNECDPGLTCDHTSDLHPICSSTCGQLGQGCCNPSVCGDGVTFICGADQICVPSNTTTSGACHGSTLYFVGTLDDVSRCAKDPITVMADDPAQATECAKATLAQLGLAGVRDLVSPTLYQNYGTEYPFCSVSEIDPNGSSFTIPAHSDEDALTCGKNYCLMDCTITAGACTN